MKGIHRDKAISFLESITPKIVCKRSDRGFDFFPGFYAENRNSPMMGEGEEWAFHVPACFCEALDIKLTLRLTDEEKEVNKFRHPDKKFKPKLHWTQGSEFNFTEGCVVYDAPTARQSGIKWGSALAEIGVAIQVASGYAASPARIETQIWEAKPEDLAEHINQWSSKGIETQIEDNTQRKNPEFKLLAFVPRVPGQIDLKIMRPNSSKTKLELDERISMSQDDFMKTLIMGLGNV